jgi:hypothetical protein
MSQAELHLLRGRLLDVLCTIHVGFMGDGREYSLLKEKSGRSIFLSGDVRSFRSIQLVVSVIT